MAPIHSKRSPAFQFYPSDFFSSAKVDRMPMTERGAYITLLARCWLDDGLSTDLAELASICRMKAPQFERMWKHSQIGKCFIEKGGKYRNHRLDQEHQKQVEYRRRQSDHGKRGGRPVGKGSESQPLSDQQGSERSPISSSSLISSLSQTSVSARPTPILARRRAEAAWEGPRGLYVLQRQHEQFVAMRNGRESELFEFYARVGEDWGHGRLKDANIEPDMPRFWNARFVEQWPPTSAPASGGKPMPEWYIRAQNAKKAAAQ
jgi:uncharacterized protein YdaU (DUF1376 family)